MGYGGIGHHSLLTIPALLACARIVVENYLVREACAPVSSGDCLLLLY